MEVFWGVLGHVEGIRPVVVLPSSIQFGKTDGVWNIQMLTLDKENIEVEIEEGTTATETLTATLEGVEGELTWTSSNTSVAEVVGNGNTGAVTIKAAGTATITVSCGELSAICTVNATQKGVEDELAGTWIFNDVITLGDYNKTYSLDFISNDESFTRMEVMTGKYGGLIYAGNGNSLDVTYAPLFEINKLYKTIVIFTKLNEMENGEEFLTWLKATAVKKEKVNLISFTVNGTTYTAEPGMTWQDWVGSAYDTSNGLFSTYTLPSGSVVVQYAEVSIYDENSYGQAGRTEIKDGENYTADVPMMPDGPGVPGGEL